MFLIIPAAPFAAEFVMIPECRRALGLFAFFKLDVYTKKEILLLLLALSSVCVCGPTVQKAVGKDVKPCIASLSFSYVIQLLKPSSAYDSLL